MNCTEFTNTIENALDGFAPELQARFDAHRESCDACRAVYASHLATEAAIVSALREMPVPEASAGFADRVLHTAVTRNVGHHHRHGFMVGFGSAATVALALWVVIGLFPGAVPPGDGSSAENGRDTVASVATSTAAAKSHKPELSIALNQQQDIKLAFYSGEALKGAKITIRLPENVALVGYPGQRQLSWTTDLNKGDNLLRLPVIATQIARGDLVADIQYQDTVKTLTVGLETKATDTSTGEIKMTPFVG
jgi:hypothetical protein